MRLQVVVSYYMQIGIVAFCSLIVPMIDFATSKSPWRQGKLGLVTQVLRKCQPTVNEISAFYSLSIYIAAIVRFTQTPPIVEIIFIGCLLTVQYSISLALLAAGFVDLRFNGVPMPMSHIGYSIGNALAGLVTSYPFRLRQDAFPVLFDLCKSCNRVYKYSDYSRYFDLTRDAGSTAKNWAIGTGIVLASLAVGAVLGLLTGGTHIAPPPLFHSLYLFLPHTTQYTTNIFALCSCAPASRLFLLELSEDIISKMAEEKFLLDLQFSAGVGVHCAIYPHGRKTGGCARHGVGCPVLE